MTPPVQEQSIDNKSVLSVTDDHDISDLLSDIGLQPPHKDIDQSNADDICDAAQRNKIDRNVSDKNTDGKALDFTQIRQMCELDNKPEVDITPEVFRQNQIDTWPTINKKYGT